MNLELQWSSFSAGLFLSKLLTWYWELELTQKFIIKFSLFFERILGKPYQLKTIFNKRLNKGRNPNGGGNGKS